MNKRDLIKQLRSAAKKRNMTLKEHQLIKINNNTAYYLIDRKSKEILISNMTLSSVCNELNINIYQ